MIQTLRKLFDQEISKAAGQGSARDDSRAYRLATAALLVEMSRADYEVKPIEHQAVIDATQRALELTREETVKLVEIAEEKADHATSLFEFTNLINTHFDAEEKAKIVEHLWDVAYADGEVDKYESHLVRKIADLLYVPHSVYIRAKLRAEERGG
ncbi:MAG: TerB family tellurite resistance protein [Gammaproteobacteria bacterium]|nr:TerB family tellurite resistance protein [Gammaproteobacteria bacterium]